MTTTPNDPMTPTTANCRTEWHTPTTGALRSPIGDVLLWFEVPTDADGNAAPRCVKFLETLTTQESTS